MNIPNYPDEAQLLDVLRRRPHVILVDADTLAKDNGMPRAVNMVLLGQPLPFWDWMPSCWKQRWPDCSQRKERMSWI